MQPKFCFQFSEYQNVLRLHMPKMYDLEMWRSSGLLTQQYVSGFASMIMTPRLAKPIFPPIKEIFYVVFADLFTINHW